MQAVAALLLASASARATPRGKVAVAVAIDPTADELANDIAWELQGREPPLRALQRIVVRAFADALPVIAFADAPAQGATPLRVTFRSSTPLHWPVGALVVDVALGGEPPLVLPVAKLNDPTRSLRQDLIANPDWIRDLIQDEISRWSMLGELFRAIDIPAQFVEGDGPPKHVVADLSYEGPFTAAWFAPHALFELQLPDKAVRFPACWESPQHLVVGPTFEASQWDHLVRTHACLEARPKPPTQALKPAHLHLARYWR